MLNSGTFHHITHGVLSGREFLQPARSREHPAPPQPLGPTLTETISHLRNHHVEHHIDVQLIQYHQPRSSFLWDTARQDVSQCQTFREVASMISYVICDDYTSFPLYGTLR